MYIHTALLKTSHMHMYVCTKIYKHMGTQTNPHMRAHMRAHMHTNYMDTHTHYIITITVSA